MVPSRTEFDGLSRRVGAVGGVLASELIAYEEVRAATFRSGTAFETHTTIQDVCRDNGIPSRPARRSVTSGLKQIHEQPCRIRPSSTTLRLTNVKGYIKDILRA
eukprot:6124382-Pyramimonas_sp.AAC.1